jgi:UDP-3-O-[3-hydroxymyristoyl] glucosamine N-acyltransferase
MTAREIAAMLGGELSGEGERRVAGVAGLDAAGPDDLAYAEGARALAEAARSRAGCLLIPEGARLAGRTTIAVKRPKLALIRVAEALYPVAPVIPGIHPTAVVAPDAEVAASASVGPGVVIASRARVGAETSLGAGVVLGEGVEVGSRCRLHPRVTVYPGARLGDRVTLHAGVVIGSDGFGYVLDEGRHRKFPQLGTVVIENDVEIGANSTVDRGSLGTTRIGEGTKIDNLVQIAHNVKIGKHCILAAQTGVSGSVEIGDYVVIAGQVGIGERARIEDHAVIGGQAGILPGKVVRAGSVLWGTPARPLAVFKRMHAAWARLPEWIERRGKS